MISSWPSTAPTARCCGPPGRRHPRLSAPSIATSARGDSYVTGFFQGTAIFGEGEPNETTLTAAGDEPTSSWPSTAPTARCCGPLRPAAPSDEETGIATTARGDSYVTGEFKGTAIFGRGRAQRDHPHRCRRDLRGQVRPRRRAAVGHPGRAARAGFEHRDHSARRQLRDRASGTATFGEGEPNETTSPRRARDIFVAK